jgi:hypothetical protein
MKVIEEPLCGAHTAPTSPLVWSYARFIAPRDPASRIDGFAEDDERLGDQATPPGWPVLGIVLPRAAAVAHRVRRVAGGTCHLSVPLSRRSAQAADGGLRSGRLH